MPSIDERVKRIPEFYSGSIKSAGYKFDNAAECRGCGEPIEWWITPNGKKLPMDPMERSTDSAVAHFKTCSEADSFRKGK